MLAVDGAAPVLSELSTGRVHQKHVTAKFYAFVIARPPAVIGLFLGRPLRQELRQVYDFEDPAALRGLDARAFAAIALAFPPPEHKYLLAASPP